VARGYSCKPCSAKRNGIANSRTQEEWNDLALKMNAKWTDTIVNKKEKATICCLDCNHEWHMRPDAVFHKARTEREMPWCPDCAKLYRNERALDNGRKHGTSGYTHGCRCFVCTEAKSKESARYRQKKKQQGK